MNLSKNITTFRSGKYSLSASFDREALLPKRLEARTLARLIENLPLTPGPVSEYINEATTIQCVFSASELEGVSVTKERVASILRGAKKRPLSGEEERVRGIANAYDSSLSDLPEATPLVITEDMIKGLHLDLTQGLDESIEAPGRYHADASRVGSPRNAAAFSGARILSDTKLLMKEFTSWINREELTELSPEARAALAHFHIASIRPFKSMNGSAARLIEAKLLAASGIPYIPRMMSGYYRNNMEHYSRIMEATLSEKKPDLTDFLDFVFTGHVEVLSGIADRVAFSLRKLAMRDYYDRLREERTITRGQHDLLSTLLEYDRSFKPRELFRVQPLKGLYREVSERTARRDLARLHSLKLLTKLKENGYRLNLNAR